LNAAHESDAAVHMDRIYRWQRGIYDLTRRHYLLGRDRLIAELLPPAGGMVIEIGCGTGRNLIAAARRYPAVRLLGLDVSRVMLETAEAAVARAGLTRRIDLVQADATRFTMPHGAPPDRVFISYALSMIPGWRSALHQALALLPPHGELFIADFGQQEGLPRWFRALLFRWLALFSVTPIVDFENELQAIAAASGRRLEFRRLYRGYAVLARFTPAP